ncbi:type II secretion system protein L [Novosphingobium pokkalii]|nr:hypothetical protein GCM10019060_11890 [Novosphingobium pokkalii]
MPDDGLILLLPEAGGPPCAAWRIAEEQAVAIPADAGLAGWPGRVTALAPPGAMPVLCQPIEDAATPAQALGLARLAAADAALAHGSLALAALEDGMVLTAQIDSARLEAWQQAVVAMIGRPADALVPAALVLPPPAAGTVYRAALGGMDLARTVAAAFAAEPLLWQALVPPEASVEPCSDAVLSQRLMQAHARPWLDVLGGANAKAGAPPRRLAWLAILVLLLALAVPVGQIARWRMAAAGAEANALAQVRARFPGVADIASAEQVVRTARRQAQAGADGWAPPTAALWQALRAAPEVRLAGLVHSKGGVLRFTLTAPDTAAIDAVLLDLQRAGWRLDQPPAPVRDGGVVVASLAMRAP